MQCKTCQETRVIPKQFDKTTSMQGRDDTHRTYNFDTHTHTHTPHARGHPAFLPLFEGAIDLPPMPRSALSAFRGFPLAWSSDSYVDAPYGKGFLVGMVLIGCFHMYGLFVRH